jgi:hypothetical protein
MYPVRGAKGGSQTSVVGRRLLTARLAAVAGVVFTLAAFLPMLPAYLSALLMICRAASCPSGELSTMSTQALQNIGIPVSAYAIYTLVITLLALAMGWSVAALLFWRKSNDWMALLVALMLVLMATTPFTYLLLQRPSPWQVPAMLLNNVAWITCFLVFSVFPSGRLVPSWIGWIPGAWAVWGVVSLHWFDNTRYFSMFYLAWLAVLLSVLGAQIYRYGRISTPAERQQTKWVIWGLSTAMVIALAVVLPHLLFPELVSQSAAYQLLSAPADPLAIFLASLSIGLAILRSRLWEIDHVINRTLVYGSLTGLLGLIYVGMVIVLQALLRLVGGDMSQSLLATVISTLAVAALFQPLRRRLQHTIDRRFYREKYDAGQTLAAFGETLRSKLELSVLCQQLVWVVQETMEPESISLWLVPPRKLDVEQTSARQRIGNAGETNRAPFLPQKERIT